MFKQKPESVLKQITEWNPMSDRKRVRPKIRWQGWVLMVIRGMDIGRSDQEEHRDRQG